MATKYSGLIALLVGGELLAIHLITGIHRRLTIRDGLAILAICLAVGSWKYVDNVARFDNALYANGSAVDGFRAAPTTRHWDRYDVLSFEWSALTALGRRDANDGALTTSRSTGACERRCTG